MTDAHFSIAVALQHGLLAATAGRCYCGEILDAFCDYALSCKFDVSRGDHYSKLNARILSGLRETNCPSILEPGGLVKYVGVQPDGLTVLAFERGRQRPGTRQ